MSFRNKKNISKDNFLLFTQMLPEVASGVIETRHIVTSVREFCKNAKGLGLLRCIADMILSLSNITLAIKFPVGHTEDRESLIVAHQLKAAKSILR